MKLPPIQNVIALIGVVGALLIVMLLFFVTPPDGNKDMINTAVKGMIIYNTSTDKLQVYDGAWTDLE